MAKLPMNQSIRTCDCSWQDESNGEIYNDRDASASANAAAPVDPEALYVVENGKEYPLASVSKRRSLFVSQASTHLQTSLWENLG